MLRCCLQWVHRRQRCRCIFQTSTSNTIITTATVSTPTAVFNRHLPFLPPYEPFSWLLMVLPSIHHPRIPLLRRSFPAIVLPFFTLLFRLLLRGQHNGLVSTSNRVVNRTVVVKSLHPLLWKIDLLFCRRRKTARVYINVQNALHLCVSLCRLQCQSSAPLMSETRARFFPITSFSAVTCHSTFMAAFAVK